jgi:hypothetical protein
LYVQPLCTLIRPGMHQVSQHTDGSLQWIPKHIVAIGEDFHSQVGDDTEVKTTLYQVRWQGYEKKYDTCEPITHLQGCACISKVFKDSHSKDLEKLAADRLREAVKKATDDLATTPKHTVLSMIGLTSPISYKTFVSFWWVYHAVSLFHTRTRFASYHHTRETLNRVCLFTLLSPHISGCLRW